MGEREIERERERRRYIIYTIYYIYTYICICIHIYIYRERERKERFPLKRFGRHQNHDLRETNASESAAGRKLFQKIILTYQAGTSNGFGSTSHRDDQSKTVNESEILCQNLHPTQPQEFISINTY